MLYLLSGLLIGMSLGGWLTYAAFMRGWLRP